MGLGGTDSSAQQLTLKQNQDTLDLIERQTQRATRDVSKLFGSAEQNLLAGNRAAADMMGQYVPQQFGALQQGNLNAQQQVLAGMPQVQNALLGLPTDMSAFQPRTVNVDTSFLTKNQMPNFQSSQDALGLSAPEARTEQQYSIDAALAGLPYFTSAGGLKGKMQMWQQAPELAQALAGLSPEARAQAIERGPSVVGLGGETGAQIWNSALSGNIAANNPLLGLDKL